MFLLFTGHLDVVKWMYRLGYILNCHLEIEDFINLKNIYIKFGLI